MYVYGTNYAGPWEGEEEVGEQPQPDVVGPVHLHGLGFTCGRRHPLPAAHTCEGGGVPTCKATDAERGGGERERGKGGGGGG